MPKNSSERLSKPTDSYFSEMSLQVQMEKTHALIMSDIERTTGITEFQLGRPDPYEEARELIREVVSEQDPEAQSP